MRKSLLITLQFPPQIGGVQTYLSEITRHVPSEWVDVLAPGDMKQEVVEDGVRITRATFTTKILWPRWIPVLFRLFALTFQRKYSLLIAGQVLPVGIAVFIVSRLTKVPYIIFAHGMDVLIPLKSPRKRNISQRIFKNAERIFCPSEYSRQLVISLGVDETRCKVLHPCIDASSMIRVTDDMRKSVRSRFGIRADTVLLTVARLVKRKGHMSVLQALAGIRSEIPDFQYVIVGDGPMAEAIDAEIIRLRLGDIVIRTSLVDPPTLNVLYDIADVFVLPVLPDPAGEDVEGFGIVYQEALVHDAAVIASDCGGVPDAVGDTARLINPGNMGQLTEALKLLITDPVERELLVQRGRRLIAQRTWEHELLPLTEIIRRTI